MKFGARRDANHAAIRDGLRKCGFRVLDLGDVGKGCPDLLVRGYGILLLVEVKDPAQPPSKRALTPAEAAFHAAWRSDVIVALTLQDVLAAFQARRAA